MNIKRNSTCWCGSGKKYKQCHEEFDIKWNFLVQQGKTLPDRSLIKNKKEIAAIKKSAAINNGVLDYISKHIKVGMSTGEIDRLVYNYTVSRGAIPAPLNYGGFPKSVCTSINHEVCHGIPDDNRILKDGDIINVDVSTIFHGYYSDASRMFLIGNVNEEAQRLVQITKECMEKGIQAIRPWGHIGDIGAAIMAHAHKHGYTVVRSFAGHGIGKEFHEDPIVAHIGLKNTGMILVPGMIITVEPMINADGFEVVIDEQNGWTSYTADGSLSAQWENMVLITEKGVEILSK